MKSQEQNTIQTRRPGGLIICLTFLGLIAGSPNSASAEEDVFLIDLATALRLAKADSNRVNLAREQVEEAEIRWNKSKLSLIPHLAFGASAYRHDGPLQETNGNILDVNRSSAQAGLGAGATGAGNATVPGIALRTDLADTLFDPLAARQNRSAAEASLLDERNQTFKEVATAYFELLRAKALFSVALESLNNARNLYETTSSFAETGQGLESDAARVSVEELVYERNLEQARENVVLRSIELARLLRIPPTTRLEPRSKHVTRVGFIPHTETVNQLIASALENNPAIAQHKALVEVATTALRKSKNAPLIPSVAISSSVSNFLGGEGDTLDHESGRADFNAAVYWELQNLGFGDHAEAKIADSVLRQSTLEKLEVMDQIAADVASSYAKVQSRRRQTDIGERAIARGHKAYEMSNSRIFENQGLPIEALHSIQSLDVAGRLYVDTISDYNIAQFALFTAIGQSHPHAEADSSSSGIEDPNSPPVIEISKRTDVRAVPVRAEEESSGTLKKRPGGLFSRFFESLSSKSN